MDNSDWSELQEQVECPSEFHSFTQCIDPHAEKMQSPLALRAVNLHLSRFNPTSAGEGMARVFIWFLTREDMWVAMQVACSSCHKCVRYV
jgi:hypothetical protein